ncbi:MULTISPECIES: glycosyltransferase [Clostridium]|jgi:teichuronic acid biosynthesis glycosyltransferase TuaH|uniref:Glycosyltransferase family 1 protein n=1 Tax=Clostridium perfringens TaxID=1502 RepID=A0AAE8FT77_CLOPF|nr:MULTISPECIES: glycosyltransferase [Clostridium]AMN31646.1 glycosyl transferase family 1 [Clostridium perfringens]EGT0689280.1 glycosyltransferase family 1 protein [Clostridium perfringens]EGT3619859.1 glycosyltransferase family 1 protein [Clostridium perfringens]EGT4140327.1 glycosyltransferase family 1 protein [Clostridium perfringens]EHK2367293.1 glycosyltransferase [Clostridium perfringens]
MSVGRIARRTTEVLKEDGLIEVIKRVLRYIKRRIKDKLDNNALTYRKNYEEANAIFHKILKKEKFKAVVVFDSRVGWNIPLFQRSQHMANELTDDGYLYFYRTSEQFDPHVKTVEKLKDRLYLVNMANFALQNAMFDLLKEYKGHKFLSLYSTDVYLDEQYIKEKYIDNGFKIIYEYIDELSDEISGHLPDFVYDRHKNIIEDKSNIAVGSADKLIEEIEEIRGKENVAMITNGVQYDHWQYRSNEVPEKLKDIVSKGNPIIGYFGALAKWFDYELLKKVAKERPNYEIVLIGFLYDNSFKDSKIDELENVHYLGIVDYKELNQYSQYFTISTIPFLLNDITESTSPVKLFEYMAMGHPIVTTDMRECRKYKSVLIGKSHEDFIEKLDFALTLDKKDEYYNYLKEEALANTWREKAAILDRLIEKNI